MKRLFLLMSLMTLATTGASPSRCFAGGSKPRQIEHWGQVINPDDDCTLAADGKKLTIRVPGTLHDLFPGQPDARKRTNAPRVLQEVKGNFTATVRVTADWQPGDRLPGATTFPYNGAGLLVWDSDMQFVRLERNVWVAPNARASYTTPLHYAGGQQVNMARATNTEFYRGRSTWLKLRRAGDKLTTSISHDGRNWTETATLEANLPQIVLVGVAAINSSNKDFLVEFDLFQLERD